MKKRLISFLLAWLMLLSLLPTAALAEEAAEEPAPAELTEAEEPVEEPAPAE